MQALTTPCHTHPYLPPTHTPSHTLSPSYKYTPVPASHPLSLAHTRPPLPPSHTPSLSLPFAHARARPSLSLSLSLTCRPLSPSHTPSPSFSIARTYTPVPASHPISLSHTHAHRCPPPTLLHSLSPSHTRLSLSPSRPTSLSLAHMHVPVALRHSFTHSLPLAHTPAHPCLPISLAHMHARDVPPLEAHTPSRDHAHTHDSLRTREVAGQLRSPQPHTAAAGLRPAPARIRLQPGSARISPALDLACYRHTQALHACGGSGVIRALSPTACTPQARRFKMPHCHPRPPGHLSTRVRTHMS